MSQSSNGTIKKRSDEDPVCDPDSSKKFKPASTVPPAVPAFKSSLFSLPKPSSTATLTPTSSSVSVPSTTASSFAVAPTFSPAESSPSDAAKAAAVVAEDADVTETEKPAITENTSQTNLNGHLKENGDKDENNSDKDGAVPEPPTIKFGENLPPGGKKPLGARNPSAS
ncbi:hypothetical protein AYI68_g586, partial [Smittium mucronatum]